MFNDDESPFQAAVAEGSPSLAVVTGENASGKSLYVRVVASLAHKDGALPVSISIRERTGGDGMRKVMMFGDEQEQSTGATSVRVIDTGFKNLDRPKGSILILDEPEIGLSEAYASALGEYIGQQVKLVPSVCLGVLVVTHSRPLVRGLLRGFEATPTHVAVCGDAEPSAGLETWLETSESHTVEELLMLREVGHARWLQVLKLLKS